MEQKMEKLKNKLKCPCCNSDVVEKIMWEEGEQYTVVSCTGCVWWGSEEKAVCEDE